MPQSKEQITGGLRERLTGATKVAVIGVGYELGSDDGAGLAAARQLQEKMPGLPVYLTGSAPENYTGPVVKERPSHVVFLDAAALGRTPGEIALIDREAIGGVTFSTHTLPLATIMTYFEQAIGAASFAIGIQPLREGFGEDITPEVRRGVDLAVEALGEVLRELKLG